MRPRATTSRVGQVGYVTANIKKLSDVTDRRHDHQRPPARLRGPLLATRSPPRWSICGLFPATHNQFEDLPNGPPEALAQRCQLHLRARVVRRPRVRLPLRLPGDAPHGDRPAAARTREQPRASPDRAQRDLRDHHQARRDAPHLQPDPDSRPRRHRGVPRARRPGQLHHPRRLHRLAHAAVRGPPRDRTSRPST